MYIEVTVFNNEMISTTKKRRKLTPPVCTYNTGFTRHFKNCRLLGLMDIDNTYLHMIPGIPWPTGHNPGGGGPFTRLA